MATTPTKAAPAAAPAADPAPGLPPAAEPLTIRTAIAHRIHAAGRRGAGPSLLDFVLVIGALSLVGYGVHGLMTFTSIPQANLPTLASLLSFLTGSILGTYAGYRWGASDAMKKAGDAVGS